MGLYKAAHLTKLVSAIFQAGGSGPAEAEEIAEQLVDANLCGHHSHGVVRVAAYIGQKRAGKVMPNRHLSVVSSFGATRIVDGNMGYGQVIGREALDLGVKASGEFGVALVGIRNSGHLGRIGYWAEQAAEWGRASLHFVSAASPGGAQIAAFGGRDRRMAANPLAFGMPVDGQPPVILDFATSEIAVGKVRVARNKGVKLPSRCIVDADGNLTDEPDALFGDRPGALIPFGGHKGYALNLFNDLLGGALTGAGIPHEGTPTSVQSGNNMMSIYVDPDAITDKQTLQRQVSTYLQWLTDSEPLDRASPVRIPGQRLSAQRERATKAGVEIDDTTWEQLLAAGEAVGLSRARMSAIGG